MLNHLDKLITELEKSPLFHAQCTALRDIGHQSNEQEIMISVIGQFKRGKSSLINSLIGCPLLPTGIIPVTSAATEVRWGSESRAEVIFENGTVQDATGEDPEQYCSEQYNSGNVKQIHAIRLWTPRHVFGPGIVLVDTPGVGSVNQGNTDTTSEHLIHSDAILFVLSVDSPVSSTELEFLMNARDYASRFYFAVNKADLVSPEELHIFLSYCQSILQEHLQREVTLYPVSARTGEGLDRLIEMLTDTLGHAGQRILSDSIRRKLDMIVRQTQAKLDLAERALSEPAEKIASKLHRMESKGAELDACAETLNVLARHHTEQLVLRVGADLSPGVDSLRRSLQEYAGTLSQELSTLPLRSFRETYQKRLDEFLKAELKQLNAYGSRRLSDGYAEVVELLSRRSSEAEAALSAFLREEFGIDYPITSDHFEVSQESDFFLQVGMRSLPKLTAELADYLSPRKAVEERFLRQCLQQAEDDITCNINNMLYNYRYKMQESLRPLCRLLSDRIHRIREELCQLEQLFRTELDTAQQKESGPAEYYRNIRSLLDLL